MEARRYGVRSGMPQFMANKLCPQAKVIRGDYELYSKCSDTVTEIIQDSAPLMEKSSIDEFYLDISGMDKYFGCFKWTNELQHRIVSESGLPISFGLSINKTVSKMATNEGKPRGNLKIDADQVTSFLNPLPIKRLPGIGHSTFQTLSRIGIRQIKTLSEVPSDVMAKLLGKTGITLSQRSRGIDHTPVKPYSKRKSISSERTFQQDTIDKHLLHTILTGMIEDLCFKLRQTIRKVAYQLLDKVYQRRMRIRLIGISFNKLVRGKYQINLFDDTEDKISLYQAMDHLKKRFNSGCVQWASGFDSPISRRRDFSAFHRTENTPIILPQNQPATSSPHGGFSALGSHHKVRPKR